MSLFMIIFTAVSFLFGFLIDFFNVETLLKNALGFDPGYGLMALVIVFNCLTLQWLGSQVMKARKMYDVKFPTLYATKAENKHANEFNCYQRAHQNTLEMQAQFLSLCLCASQQYPTVAALAGFVVVLSRYFYAWGYYTGNPDGRYRGAFGYFGFFALLGCTMMYGATQLGINVPQLVQQYASSGNQAPKMDN